MCLENRTSGTIGTDYFLLKSQPVCRKSDFVTSSNGEKSRSPRLIPGQGQHFTLNALFERIWRQFIEETAERPDILAELDTVGKQRTAIRETADYIITTEALALSAEEKTHLLEALHKDLFRFGPLEGLFEETMVTEINIDTPDKISVRRGLGDLEPLAARFRDGDHLMQMLQRLLAPAGVWLDAEDGFLEAGVMCAGRPIRLSFVGPPMMPYYQGSIRLHPPQPLHLADLEEAVPPLVQSWIQKILARGYGLLVVGDNNVGKTTVVSSLLALVPSDVPAAFLERTAETHPALIPAHFKRYLHSDEGRRLAFAAQIHSAVDDVAPVIFMDEIRGDEGGAVWRLLTDGTARQIVTSFRGRGDSARLLSGISMALRKNDAALPQEEINAALLARLPFVMVLSRPAPHNTPRFVSLAQWKESGSSLTLEALVEWKHNDVPARTHHAPRFDLSDSLNA